MRRVKAAVTKENGRDLRIQEMEKVKADPSDTKEGKIMDLLITAWGEWQPDYEGWIKWSNGLYAENATIDAIDGEKNFRDYQVSMKDQRDACSMEMGPIMQMTVEGNVAALVYHMYLTPKVENAPTFDMIVTEFNTVEEIDGKLMVTHLDLYTDGGGLSY